MEQQASGRAAYSDWPHFLAPDGTPRAESAYGVRFLFTGREYLAPVGLYDHRHRVYSPSLGRFLQVDPVGRSEYMRSLYAYAANSVVQSVDPPGLQEELPRSHSEIRQMVKYHGIPVCPEYEDRERGIKRMTREEFLKELWGALRCVIASLPEIRKKGRYVWQSGFDLSHLRNQPFFNLEGMLYAASDVNYIGQGVADGLLGGTPYLVYGHKVLKHKEDEFPPRQPILGFYRAGLLFMHALRSGDFRRFDEHVLRIMGSR